MIVSRATPRVRGTQSPDKRGSVCNLVAYASLLLIWLFGDLLEPTGSSRTSMLQLRLLLIYPPRRSSLSCSDRSGSGRPSSMLSDQVTLLRPDKSESWCCPRRASRQVSIMALGLFTYSLLCPIMGAGTGRVRRRPLIGDERSRRCHIIEHVRDGARLVRTDGLSRRLPGAAALSDLGLQLYLPLYTWHLAWTLARCQQRQGYWHGGDANGQAHAHHAPGHACLCLTEYATAAGHVRQGLLHCGLGDPYGEDRPHPLPRPRVGPVRRWTPRRGSVPRSSGPRHLLGHRAPRRLPKPSTSSACRSLHHSCC